ncbi:hypothetical protein [Actinomadura rubrisoli]|uniref:Uncharacterized protein n=1 Tax=Actinomadura rubrisoli TaxID=2530368 RepID=A0A4R4ZRJ0_9ACTN|nr:hypothetical protein [Actinomadura rubrisoli]TDD61638.1 hypothetical protein E1298_45245 [Actinomadura rubrisoli]
MDKIARPNGRQRAAREWLAVCATERALLSALIAARHLGLYHWSGNLDVATELEASVQDCFPTQKFHPTASL